jgi:hypothetical protein
MRILLTLFLVLNLFPFPSAAQPSCRVENWDYLDRSIDLGARIEQCILAQQPLEVEELRHFVRNFNSSGAALTLGNVLAIRPLSVSGDVDLARLAVPWFSRGGFHAICERLSDAFRALNERCPLAGIFNVDMGAILNAYFTSDPRNLGTVPMLLHSLRIEGASSRGSRLRLEGNAASPIVVQSVRIEASRLEYLSLRHLVVLGNLEVVGSSASLGIENVLVLGDVDLRESRFDTLFVRGIRGAGTLRLSDLPITATAWSVRGAAFRSVVGNVEQICPASPTPCPDWHIRDIARFIAEAVIDN